jgi:murein DD-endopeptidase MepM/ murein hydrolase activator NlpD
VVKPVRRWLTPVFVFIAVAASLAPSYADGTPPKVYIEVPERTPAELPFNLIMSSDEPVTYTVKYGGLELSEVAQDYTASLIAQTGATVLNVTATDSSENKSEYEFVVYGIPTFKPTLQVQTSVSPGEPLAVTVSWDAGNAQPTSVNVTINGETKAIFISEGRAVALWGVPLGTEPSSVPVKVTLADGYERTVVLEQSVDILADTREVEELNLSTSTTDVITPEGRELEKQTMDAAYAKAAEQPFPLWSEAFMQPIEGRFTSSFGQPRRYVAGGNLSFHYGADIAAPQGTPIYATNAGRVLVADFYPIKGGLVVIDHGASVYSIYMHQSKIVAKVGESVSRGQQIGEVGTTGLSTGPHLHWEIRVNQVATNPLTWVGKVLP